VESRRSALRGIGAVTLASLPLLGVFFPVEGKDNRSQRDQPGAGRPDSGAQPTVSPSPSATVNTTTVEKGVGKAVTAVMNTQAKTVSLAEKYLSKETITNLAIGSSVTNFLTGAIAGAQRNKALLRTLPAITALAGAIGYLTNSFYVAKAAGVTLGAFALGAVIGWLVSPRRSVSAPPSEPD
jgi:hypothetical protein